MNTRTIEFMLLLLKTSASSMQIAVNELALRPNVMKCCDTPICNDFSKLISMDYCGVPHAKKLMARSSHAEKYTINTFVRSPLVNIEAQIRPHDCYLTWSWWPID